MATVVTIMDRSGWEENTDVIVVADPARKLLCWIPRDLWCNGLGDRINAAFKYGHHQGIISALAELDIVVEHSLCVRREATELALAGLRITVPVEREQEFWYPLTPNRRIQDGRMRVCFRPPSEVLDGDRIHQWIGARYSVRSDTNDLDRIQRQQVLLRQLLKMRHTFATVISDPELVDRSSEEAIVELRHVDSSWCLDTIDNVIAATIDGKMVLLRRGIRGQLDRPVPILRYRRIGDPPAGDPSPGLYVARCDFARQLEELELRGYVAVTQRQLFDGWNAECELPPQPIVISFDDGHPGVWREALPLLSGHGWPAVLNLRASMIDAPGGIAAEMVRELLDAGWELGAQSRTNAALNGLNQHTLDGEVLGSQSDLEEQFSSHVESFCYPSAGVAAHVIDSVMRAGYRGATMARPGLAGPQNLYEMPRINVSRSDGAAQLAEHVKGMEETASRKRRAQAAVRRFEVRPRPSADDNGEVPGRYVLRFESFGTPIELRVDDLETLDQARAALPPGSRPLDRAAPPARFELLGDDVILLNSVEVGRAGGDRRKALTLLASILRDHVAVNASDRVFVHAGVVSHHTVGIVIPGSSFTGKTTLVAKLVEAGAKYYSDEYAVIDGDGLIHPFPKPLGIRTPSTGHLGQPTPVPTTRTGREPVRAGVVIVTSYEPGMSWRPVRKTPAEGVLMLLEHTVVARSRSRAALAAARRVAEHSQILCGPRGEAEALVVALLEMTERVGTSRGPG
jgi:peptidoglycan/xylan/chitin deacetylase (PgdA/CDA1 family)